MAALVGKALADAVLGSVLERVRDGAIFHGRKDEARRTTFQHEREIALREEETRRRRAQ